MLVYKALRQGLLIILHGSNILEMRNIFKRFRSYLFDFRDKDIWKDLKNVITIQINGMPSFN